MNSRSLMLNAFSDARSASGAWVAQIDFGRVLNQIDTLASRFGESTELPLQLVGESFPVTLRGVVAGRQWRGAIELDAADIARFAAALEQDD